MMEVCIEVHQHPRYSHGGIQISIGDDHGGYRIAGPKFDGSSKLLSKRTLDKRDIAEIRKYLDKAEAALNTTDNR